MNNQYTGAIGVNAAIELVKNDVYDTLNDLWEGSFDAYGRMYKLEREEGWIPAWYQGNKQYKEILIDDRACMMYFDIDDTDTTEDELVFTTKVNVVFMLNLDIAYPNSVVRSDTEAQRDVVEVFRENNFERFAIKGIKRSLKSIFSGVDTQKLVGNNTQPYHIFSLELDLQYYLTDKCN